jgi:hypothetical protein
MLHHNHWDGMTVLNSATVACIVDAASKGEENVRGLGMYSTFLLNCMNA